MIEVFFPLSFEASHSGVNAVAQRLDAEPFEQRMLIEPALADQIHIAEAARIRVADRGAVAHVKHDMLMRRCGRRLVVEAPRLECLSIGAVDAEAAGHAEMHHQHLAVVEPGEQVLRPSVERLDLPPGEPLGEIDGERKAQILAPLLDAREAIADQHRLKAHPHGFNLRKFGHSGLPAMRKVSVALQQ